MIETQLRTQRDDLVRPPGDADRMLRVFRRVTGATANDVVVKLIPQCKERSRRNSEHCVAENPPFRRETGSYRKGATLKRDRACWMRLRVIHIHVEGFGRGVDLVVELVRPGSNDLLQIVVTEFAVVKRVVASVDGISLVSRCPLNHQCTCGLVPGIVLP